MATDGSTRFLIVVLDALRPEFVSRELMPNLHRFATDGVRFLNSRSTFPTPSTNLSSQEIDREDHGGRLGRRGHGDQEAPALAGGSGGRCGISPRCGRGRHV